MALGEIRSKVDHLSRALLAPGIARELHDIYLAKGVLATTAIEGNTLSEGQVVALLNGDLTLPKSQEYLKREVLNIIDACNGFVSELALGGSQTLTPALFVQLNKAVLFDLEVAENVVPGEIPTWTPVVGSYKAVERKDVEHLLARLCDWINADLGATFGVEMAVPLAVLKAIYAHLYFAWIHPFGDGNGRTARLIEVRLLLAAGLPTPAAHLLSNHYNATRTDYYRRLQEASRKRDAIGFVEYAIQGLVDGLTEQVDRIWRHQYAEAWRQFVYRAFEGSTSRSAPRRLAVMLAISDEPGPVAISAISLLTPEIALAYSSMTKKAVTRDVNALEAEGLLRRVGSTVEPAREQIQGLRALTVGP
jgi:Fic family protein